MAGDEKSSPITVVGVPVAAPAPACRAFGVEVGAVYTAALNDVLPGVDGMNSRGVDVTGVYDISPNWAATVRSVDYSTVPATASRLTDARLLPSTPRQAAP